MAQDGGVTAAKPRNAVSRAAVTGALGIVVMGTILLVPWGRPRLEVANPQVTAWAVIILLQAAVWALLAPVMVQKIHRLRQDGARFGWRGGLYFVPYVLLALAPLLFAVIASALSESPEALRAPLATWKLRTMVVIGTAVGLIGALGIWLVDQVRANQAARRGRLASAGDVRRWSGCASAWSSSAAPRPP